MFQTGAFPDGCARLQTSDLGEPSRIVVNSPVDAKRKGERSSWASNSSWAPPIGQFFPSIGQSWWFPFIFFFSSYWICFPCPPFDTTCFSVFHSMLIWMPHQVQIPDLQALLESKKTVCDTERSSSKQWCFFFLLRWKCGYKRSGRFSCGTTCEDTERGNINVTTGYHLVLPQQRNAVFIVRWHLFSSSDETNTKSAPNFYPFHGRLQFSLE